MFDEEIVVKKLETRNLKNNEKIRGTENFQISMRKLKKLTKTEEQMLRKKLTSPENYVESSQLINFSNHNIFLSLFILFSMAVVVTSFGLFFDYVRDAKSNAWVAFVAGLFLEMIIAVPFLLYLRHRGNYKKAVKDGSLKVYQFAIEQKVILEYSNDGATMYNYYIVVGSAYVQIGKKLYDRLHVGNPARIAISGYKGDDYFALINDWGELW